MHWLSRFLSGNRPALLHSIAVVGSAPWRLQTHQNSPLERNLLASMAVPFGFSVGDFINGILLAKDVIQALSDSRGSHKEYNETILQLNSLEQALGQIEGSIADLQSSTQWTVLAATLTSCRAVIDDFLQGIEKYHVSLSRKGPKAIWKDTLRKIQWQFSMPEELASFRGKLSLSLCTIGLLFHTIQ
jgi:hypothetical protein